jgi:hypothetical protein
MLPPHHDQPPSTSRGLFQSLPSSRNHTPRNVPPFNCDGIPNADFSEKLDRLVTYVQEQHIAILLETRTNELTRLSSQLHTHTHIICYHNNVETRGRRGQGVAIFVTDYFYNSLAGLVRMWKISELYQAV